MCKLIIAWIDLAGLAISLLSAVALTLPAWQDLGFREKRDQLAYLMDNFRFRRGAARVREIAGDARQAAETFRPRDRAVLIIGAWLLALGFAVSAATALAGGEACL